MFWQNDDSAPAQSMQSYQDINVQEHEPSKVHELLAGAAAFEGMRKWEEHEQNVDGQKPDHAMFKEFAAAAAGAFIDRECESKGMDFIDQEKAKYDAKKQISQQMNQNSDQFQNYDPNQNEYRHEYRDENQGGYQSENRGDYQRENRGDYQNNNY